jgi:exonuclease-1
LYKLDKNGFADEITLDRLGHNTDIELSDFNLPKFRQMCILSGCDYLDSISGFGLKTCHKYFLKYKTADRVIQAIPGKVPEDFERAFKMAELTFAHQRVYDMRAKECVHLNALDEDWVLSEEAAQFDNWDFVGPHLDPAVAYQQAIGELNPMTKIPFRTSHEESPNTSQESFTAEEPPVKVVRSRFFQTQSKESDSSLPARLTLKSNHVSVLENKENEPVKQAASARHFGTHASKSKPVSKAFNTNPNRDYLKSNVPSYLFPQKRPLAVSKKPLRLNPTQPTLFDYAKQKKESK